MTPPVDPPTPPSAGSSSGARRAAAWLRARGPFASGTVAALLAIWLYGMLLPGPQPLTQRDVRDTVDEVLASITPGPARSQLVYAVAQHSIVLVATERGLADQADGGFGTGVVVDAQGDILTSLHIVDEAHSIEVTFADGTQSAAEIVAAEPDQDIAVLRTDQLPDVLVPAVLGDPGAVHVGDEAYVLGNPFGLSSSMSAGVISGKDRSIRHPDIDRNLTGLIQFDAAVNRGNSGGPLLNRDGQVIGIVAALLNPTEDRVFIGIGLAVPINVAGGAVDLPPY